MAAALLCAFAAPPVPAEVAATQLIGARLSTARGIPVGTIADLLCEAPQDRIADLVVSRGALTAVVPWTAMSRVAPGRFIAASPVALALGESVGDALDSDPRLLDVAHDLIGRPLTASDGTPAGRVAGLTLDASSGRVASLLVDPIQGGRPADTLPWSAVANFFVEHAIILNLTAQQVAALPAPPARLAAF